MVLGDGERHVVAVVPDLLHVLLVDDGPHEAVESALGVLAVQLGGARKAGDELGLPAIKGVQGGLKHVLGLRGAVKGKAEQGLEDDGERVEALQERELHVDKGHVGAAGRVGGKLEQALLLDQVVALLGVEVGQGLVELVALLAHDADGHAREAHRGELGRQGRAVGADPLLGLGAVQAGAEEVQDQHDGHDGQNDSLGLELGQAVALMDIVPLCVGRQSRGRAKGVRRGRARGGREGGRHRIGRLVEVGEV